MKASDQVSSMKSGFDISTHSLFSAIASAIQAKMAADAGVTLSFVGKVTSGGGSMRAVLIADAPVESAEKVEQTMADLKNPSALVDLLK